MVNSSIPVVRPMSQAAIGRALGLSPASMTKLKGQGMPVDSVESARAWRVARQNIAARKVEPSGSSAPPTRVAPDSFAGIGMGTVMDPAAVEPADPVETHDAARTRREIAEANLAEMKESELRGDLIRVSAVKAELSTVFAGTRDTLLQIPARLAPLLAADADPASVQNTLHTEIHLALQHLAGASERVGQAESAI